MKTYSRPWIKYATLIVVIFLGAMASSRIDRNLANSLTDVLLLCALGSAWNIVAGFGGQISLGHSIFIGLGGYITAILLVHSSLPLLVAVLLASLISSIIGVLLAYPMIRLRGPYFAIGTLGIALATVGWMLNWDFTNRSQAYSLPMNGMLDINAVYRLAVVVFGVTLLISILVRHSRIGLRLFALRDDESGATSLGVRRTTTILPVWAISAFLTGLIGATLAIQKGTLDPNSAFSLQFTMDAIVVCIIGGLGTTLGPVIGGILVYELRQQVVQFDSLGLLIEAIVVVAFLRFIPSGIVNVISDTWNRFRLMKVGVKDNV